MPLDPAYKAVLARHETGHTGLKKKAFPLIKEGLLLRIVYKQPY